MGLDSADFYGGLGVYRCDVAFLTAHGIVHFSILGNYYVKVMPSNRSGFI
jgi:hypothetical protein